jgi:hypothetical protein
MGGHAQGGQGQAVVRRCTRVHRAAPEGRRYGPLDAVAAALESGGAASPSGGHFAG